MSATSTESVSNMLNSNETSYLGKGIYDIAEIARMISVSRYRVETWTRPSSTNPPILTGELAGLFSFWDLVSLRVIAALVNRGVRRDHIIAGSDHLTRSLGTNRPFAHEKLATVGAGFFANVTGEWEDAGQGGQLAFQSVIRPLLDPITFNDSSMAAIWRPYPGVWVNPLVQAGTSCVDGTRVPTSQIARLLGNAENPAREDIDEMCDDYRLKEEQVLSALRYELTLAA